MAAEDAKDVAAQIVTPEQAVDLIWKEVFAGRSSYVAEAARALWPRLRFKEEDLLYLALYGLSEMAAHEQRLRRAEGTGPRPAIGYGAPHGKKKWDAYLALTWPYQGSDGQQRALLDFTADDLAAIEQSFSGMARAYGRRAKWAKKTRSLLAEHEAERVRDLPEGVLAQVEASALEMIGPHK